MKCYTIKCYIMNCYTMKCYVIKCYIIKCYSIKCYIIKCYIIKRIRKIVFRLVLGPCNSSILPIVGQVNQIPQLFELNLFHVS